MNKIHQNEHILNISNYVQTYALDRKYISFVILQIRMTCKFFWQMFTRVVKLLSLDFIYVELLTLPRYIITHTG